MKMITKNEKALAIANAEGWEESFNGWINIYTRQEVFVLQMLIDIYTSYNYLMPIVERINKDFYNKGILLKVRISEADVEVVDYNYRKKNTDKYKDFVFDTNYNQLDALLDAIYYVLVELKDKRNETL